MAATDATLELALARDLMAGKPEAFDRFVGYFRPKIFSYARMICGSREDAEEVTQDALMKAFSSFDQLRERERVKAWVLRIARNGKRTRAMPRLIGQRMRMSRSAKSFALLAVTLSVSFAC